MNERIDPKLRVMMAIYAEYQKDVPEMERVKALKMDCVVMASALIKLENEGLISGLRTEPPGCARADLIERIDLSRVLPTREGLGVVERFIETGKTETAHDRVLKLRDAAGRAEDFEIRRFADGIIWRFRADHARKKNIERM